MRDFDLDDTEQKDIRFKYFYKAMRSGTSRLEYLDEELLEELYQEQEGRCALSGRKLTFHTPKVKGGRTPTNCSIDRIQHGGTYDMENIRLVCNICNIMRWEWSDDELLYWCNEILNYNTPGFR